MLSQNTRQVNYKKIKCTVFFAVHLNNPKLILVSQKNKLNTSKQEIKTNRIGVFVQANPQKWTVKNGNINCVWFQRKKTWTGDTECTWSVVWVQLCHKQTLISGWHLVEAPQQATKYELGCSWSSLQLPSTCKHTHTHTIHFFFPHKPYSSLIL